MLNRPLLRPLAILAIGTLAALSCGREVTAPETQWMARGFTFLTDIGPGGQANSVASDLVPVQTVRVVLTNAAGSVVINRVVTFGATDDEISLSLNIPLSNPDGEILALTLAYANAAGDTVFRGGPVNVPLLPTRPNSPPPTPPVVPLDYTGPGAEATRVVIAPAADTVVSGDAFAFTATAYDAQMNVVADAPIAWRSLNPALAPIADGTEGAGTTLAGRGLARLEAYLLNEGTESDTAGLEVLPKASAVQLVSGNNQSAATGALLADSVVVRVRATDNLPMSGVAVTFAANNGGSVAPAAGVTDANGLVATAWTLGAGAGAQTATATATGLSGSPVTFTATATAPVVALLHHFQFASGMADAVGTSSASLLGGALVDGDLLDLSGDGAYVEFTQPLVPTAGSFSLSFFILNRTPDPEPAAYLSQGLEASHLRVGQGDVGNWTIWSGAQIPESAPGVDGLFRHVVVTVNRSTNQYQLYVNNQLRESSFIVSFDPGGTPLRLGRGAGTLGDYFDGQLDELRIYSGVITAAEVAALWTAGPTVADRVVWTTQPSDVQVAATISPAPCVEVQDALGRLRTTYNGAVNVQIVGNPPVPSLLGSNLVEAVNGVACFPSLSFDAAATGLQLQASAVGATGVPSAAFDVLPPAATHLAWDQSPTSELVGEPIVPALVVKAFGAGSIFASDFSGPVTLSIASGTSGAVLGGTLTVNAVAGSATFSDITIDRAGNYQLTASSLGLTDALSPTFTISDAPATQLVFTQQPSAAIANAAIAPAVVVEARTAANTLATGFSGNVTMAIGNNPGASSLGGTVTVAAVNGVATFSNLSINNVGAGYTLVASASGLTGATSAAFPITAAAVTNSWTNASGGAWSDPANWSQGRVPIGTDTVAITLAGTYTVSMDTDVTATRLVLGGASGVQTITGASRVIAVSGGIDIGSTAIFQMIGGNINGVTGLIHVRGAFHTFASVNNNAPLYVDTTGALRAHGSNVYGGGSFVAASGFTNDGIVEFQSLGSAFTSNINIASGVLVNGPTGSILATMANGGNATLTAPVQNDGVMSVSASLTLNRANTTTVNNGSIAITASGTLAFNTGAGSSFVNNGDISIASGRTFSVNGGSVDLSAGDVLGVDGLVSLSSATLTFDASRFEPNLQAAGSGVTLTAPLVVASGDSLRVRAGNFYGAGADISGALIWRGVGGFAQAVDVQPSGTLVVRSSGYNGSAAFVASAGLINGGTIDIFADGAGYSTELVVSGASLVNESGGIIRVLPGTGGGVRSITGTLENHGTLDVQTSLSLLGAEADHVNLGTINVSTGTFTVSQTGSTPTFTNSGVINVSAGRTFTVLNGTATFTSGIVNGRDGYFATSGTPTVQLSSESVRPHITLSSGTVLPDPFVLAAGDTLQLLNGTFAPPALTNNGTLLLQGSPTITTPSFTTAPTSAIVLRGTNVPGAGNADATISNGFTNHGTLTLTATVTGYLAALNMPSGTLVNSPTGVIVSAVGTGGARGLNAELENHGRVTVAQQLSIGRTDAHHVNDGFIELTTANLIINASGSTPSFVNNDSVLVASGRTLFFSGGTVDLRPGIVAGRDGFVVTSGVGSIQFESADLRPRITLGGTTSLPDPFVLPAGDTLRVLNGYFAPPSLTNEGVLALEGNPIISTPSLTTVSGSTILVRGTNITGAGNASATFTNGFTNTATIDLSSVVTGYAVSLAVTNGNLVNAPSGVIRSLVGTGGLRTIAAALDNQGTVTIEQPLTLTRAGAQHVNTGTIALTTANFNVVQTGTTPSFTNANSITLAAGRTLTIDGGAIELRNGVVSGRDAFFVTTGAPTLHFENEDLRPRITLSAGTVLPEPFTVPAGDTLRLLNGTFAPPALTNDGVLAFEGDVILTTPTLTTNPGSKLLVRGINVTGAGNASATITNAFTNTAAIDLTTAVTGYAVTLTVPNGTFVNSPSGTITSVIGTGGSRTISAQLENHGTITVLQPLTLSRADVDLVNAGLIDLQTGNLSITQTGATPSFTNTGTVNLVAGRTLTVAGGLIDFTDGIVDGRDAFFVTTGTPTLLFTSATLRPRLTLSATTNIPDPFEVPASDTLRLLNGTFAPPSLLNSGVLALEGDVTVTTPSISTAAGSTILVRGINVTGAGNASATFTNGFTNTATIDLSTVVTGYAVTLTVANGTLTNASTGVLRSLVGTGGIRSIAAQLDNQGLVTVQQPLSLNRASAAHVNSGTIDLASANLTVTQTGTNPSFTNLNSIQVASGRTLTFAGGLVDLDAGLVDGRDGFFVTTGSPTLLFTNATLRPRLTLSATTILPDPFEVPAADTLRLLNGTFAPPSLLNNGVLALEGTPVINTPTMTTGTGSTILVRGTNVTGAGNANATFTNGFTNTATIDLTTVNTGYAVTLTVTNGTLTNGASGVIRSLAGTGGSRTLAAQLDNQGTLQVSQALLLDKLEADHVNNGLIDLVGGNLTVAVSGITPTFVNNDSIHVPAARTLFFSGTGDFDLRPGVVAGRDGFFITTGAPTLRFENEDLRPRITLSTGTVIPDPFVVPVGDTLRLLDGSFAPPSLTNNGVLVMEGAGVVNTPTLVTGTGSTILVRGINVTGAGNAVATFTNGFTNTALVELTAVSTGYAVELRVTNGSLDNAASGTIRTSAGSGGTRTLAAQLDNSGTLEILQATTLSKASAAHVNRVPMSLSTANLTVTQTGTAPSFTTLDAITVGSGRTFTLSGGTFDVTAGAVNGAGTLSLSGTALAAGNSSMLDVPVNFGTSSTLATPLQIPLGDSLRIIGGTLAGSNALEVDGRLVIVGNSTISAPIVTATSGAVIVRASTANGSVILTTPNGWTNTGLVELVTETGTNSASFNVTNGTFVNAPGATLRAAAGSGGARNFAAAIDNQGTFDVQRSTTVNRTSSVHSNSGTINIAAASSLSITQGGTTPSFTNTGTVNLAASTSTLGVSGGTFTATSGLIDGLGSLSLGGTQVLDLAVPAIDVPVNFGTGPTLLNPLTVPVGDTLAVTGGTIAGAGLHVAGTLAVSGNTVITAPLTNAPNSEIDVLVTTLSIPQSWTNTGFLRLSAPNNSNNPTLNMAGQTLTIANGAFLEMPIGAGANRYLDAALVENYGTMDIEAGFIFNNGTLNQRLNLTVATGRTFTLPTLNLLPGSTTIINGTLNVTTCNNTGGSISGTYPGSCNAP